MKMKCNDLQLQIKEIRQLEKAAILIGSSLLLMNSETPEIHRKIYNSLIIEINAAKLEAETNADKKIIWKLNSGGTLN